MRMPITALLAMFVGASAACGRAHPPGGPLPQFTGEYRIVQTAEAEALVPEGFGGLSRLSRISSSAGRVFARDLGTVQVATVLGGAYSDWTVTFNEPAHEIRMLVGGVTVNGRFPVWRFEEEPAPAVVHEGRGWLEAGQFIAEFPSIDVREPRRILRERWVAMPDGRLEFTLEAGEQGQEPRRVGGFIAARD